MKRLFDIVASGPSLAYMRLKFVLFLLYSFFLFSCGIRGDELLSINTDKLLGDTVSFHAIDMYNIVNTGINTSKFSLGQLFRLSNNSIIFAKGSPMCDVLIALGDDAMMLNWNSSETRRYLSNWSKEVFVNNANYGARYVFVLFGHDISWPLNRDYLSEHCMLSISDALPFEDSLLSGVINAKAVAHRGIHVNGIPENSLISYETAAQCGMDMVEADVCVTKDRKFIMSHNTNLSTLLVEKTNGKALAKDVPISSLTFDQIRLDYRLKSPVREYVQQIPSLSEYLRVCKKNRAFAFLEIKSGEGEASFSQSEAREVCDLCLKILGKESFCIQCMDYSLLDYIRSIYDDLNLCYMYRDIRGTNNSITENSRFTKYTHTMLVERDLSEELVQSYKSNGSWVFDGDLVMPTTMSSVIQAYDGPAIIGNICGPNLAGKYGIKKTSKNGWDIFTHNGKVENGILRLIKGQYLATAAPIVYLGGQMITMKFSGKVSIKSSYDDSVIVDSSTFDEYLRRDLIYMNFGGYYIEAEDETIIEKLDFEFTTF